MPDHRSLVASLILPLFTLAPAAPALAAEDWVATQVSGTVFSLIDEKWHEVATGDVVQGRVVRTLESGQLQLDSAGIHLALGTNTAIQLQTGAVVQFSGSVTVETSAAEPLVVVAKALVTTVSGAATLSFSGGEVSVDVASGTVTVVDASHGQSFRLVAGQSIDASGEGIELASTTGSSLVEQASGGPESTGDAEGDNSNAGGNGNGNPGSGNAGGNSGEHGKSDGSNFGGDSDENSGGNGGGNGNSNGNGN